METSTTVGLRSLLDKGKLFFKAGIIFVMALILLIPASFVTDLVNERQSRQKEAILDISSKWGGRQTVVSPFLAVPYNERTLNAEGRTILVKGKAYFLPKAVRTNVKVIPEKRYRGIYQVVVYRSEISLQGEFGPLNYQSLKIDPSDMLWNEAAIVYKVSDNQRGINEDVNLHWDDSTVNFQAQESQQSFLNDAFSASLPLNAETITRSHAFSMKFTLNGSEQLLFATNAKETDLKMQSDWEAPSFSGVKLPDNR